MPAGAPLFTSLLNFRHSPDSEQNSDRDVDAHDGADDDGEVVWSEERSEYPLVLSVDDLGASFQLTVQASDPVSADRVCALVRQALAELLQAAGSPD